MLAIGWGRHLQLLQTVYNVGAPVPLELMSISRHELDDEVVGLDWLSSQVHSSPAFAWQPSPLAPCSVALDRSKDADLPTESSRSKARVKPSSTNPWDI